MAVALAAVACTVDPDADGAADPDDVVADASTGDSGDSGRDVGGPDAADGPDSGPDDDSDDQTGDEEDASDIASDAPDDGDTRPAPSPLLPLRRHADPPRASLIPPMLEACGVIDATRCVDGAEQRCAIWGNGAWVDDPPRTLEQAYVFDRYADLYHTANGQVVDVRFTEPIPQGTPEEEWSRPERFAQMDAYGDAAGWTGTALWAAAARYQSTGTSADYLRLLDKFEAMMMHYEVTGIPGMIARSHFGLLEQGAPLPVGRWGDALSPWFSADGTSWHFHYPISPSLLDRLPDYYQGSVGIGGETWATEARWMGDASRDMYVRSLPGILLASEVLGLGEREDRLRAQVRSQVPCTLNRLKRGRVTNLQARPELLDAVVDLLGGGAFRPDEGDFDLTTLDTLVFFVMEQPRPETFDAFDATCPDGPPAEVDPRYTFDATDSAFVTRLATTLARVGRTHTEPIAWIQIPSVRAADLVFVLQWGLVGHFLTGDVRYLYFVEDLIAEVPLEGVLSTWASYELPKWCQSHYAPSLSYPSMYALLARMDQGGAVARALSRAATEELAEREMRDRGDAFFGVLYGEMYSPLFDPDGASVVSTAIRQLEGYGIDPENLREPDRNVRRDWVTSPPAGVELESLGEDDRALCETPVQVFGIDLGAPGLSDAQPRAVDALPLSMRVQSGFLWTSDPWQVAYNPGADENRLQYPMLGLTTPYWIGRADGKISDGAFSALAWRDTGASCPP